MIALFDEMPRFCPSCGLDFDQGSEIAKCVRNVFLAKGTNSCSGCGFHFQKADANHILDAATKSGGNLRKCLGL